MLNRKLRIGLLLLLSTLLTGGIALAAWSSNRVLLTSVEVGAPSASATPYTMLYFDAQPTPRPPCATANGHALVGTAENIRAQTALATAAFLAGRQVSVFFEGTTCDPGNIGRVTRIQVF